MFNKQLMPLATFPLNAVSIIFSRIFIYLESISCAIQSHLTKYSSKSSSKYFSELTEYPLSKLFFHLDLTLGFSINHHVITIQITVSTSHHNKDASSSFEHMNNAKKTRSHVESVFFQNLPETGSQSSPYSTSFISLLIYEQNKVSKLFAVASPIILSIKFFSFDPKIAFS